MKCCYNSCNCTSRPLNCDRKDFITRTDAHMLLRKQALIYSQISVSSLFLTQQKHERSEPYYLIEYFSKNLIMAVDILKIMNLFFLKQASPAPPCSWFLRENFRVLILQIKLDLVKYLSGTMNSWPLVGDLYQNWCFWIQINYIGMGNVLDKYFLNISINRLMTQIDECASTCFCIL